MWVTVSWMRLAYSARSEQATKARRVVVMCLQGQGSSGPPNMGKYVLSVSRTLHTWKAGWIIQTYGR